MAELPPVLERELLTRFVTCNFIVCGDVFVDLSLSLWDKLWSLIRSVHEVSLLI